MAWFAANARGLIKNTQFCRHKHGCRWPNFLSQISVYCCHKHGWKLTRGLPSGACLQMLSTTVPFTSSHESQLINMFHDCDGIHLVEMSLWCVTSDTYKLKHTCGFAEIVTAGEWAAGWIPWSLTCALKWKSEINSRLLVLFFFFCLWYWVIANLIV